MFFVSAVFLISACQINVENIEYVEEELYEGVSLNIGVVGELPNVKEEQINFDEILLDELFDSHPEMYDAIFIMEDHLSDASHKKYVEMYKERKTPFFFVGSKANSIPFMDVNNPASYEEEAAKVNDTQNFISGMMYENEDEGYLGWKFSYPINNNEPQRDNAEGIYSEVFKVIEEETVNKY